MRYSINITSNHILYIRRTHTHTHTRLHALHCGQTTINLMLMRCDLCVSFSRSLSPRSVRVCPCRQYSQFNIIAPLITHLHAYIPILLYISSYAAGTQATSICSIISNLFRTYIINGHQHILININTYIEMCTFVSHRVHTMFVQSFEYRVRFPMKKMSERIKRLREHRKYIFPK